jgi:erythromycin esterase
MLLMLLMLALARPTRPGWAELPAPWLRAHAIPLATAEPSADTSDLEPFLQMVAGKRVIALGDATHGTHELYALKQRLIPLLIERADVRTVVLEAPYADAAPTGFDNYWFWDTAEVQDLLRDLDVEVVGVDPFLASATIARVVELVRRQDAALADDIARRYDCLGSYADNPLAYGSTPARSSCQTVILSVRPLLAARFPNDAELLHAARIVEQGEEAWATNLANRDAAMAENIAWLAQHREGNLVVWGHNEHFGKTPYILNGPTPVVSTGALLTAELGERYFVLGSVVDGGLFNAAELIGAGGIIRPFNLPSPKADDYATLLRAARQSLMLVPLRAPLPYWLAGTHRMRIAGSNVSAPDRPMVELTQDLGAKYDAIVYIETSTPTRLTNPSTAARRDEKARGRPARQPSGVPPGGAGSTAARDDEKASGRPARQPSGVSPGGAGSTAARDVPRLAGGTPARQGSMTHHPFACSSMRIASIASAAVSSGSTQVPAPL